MLDPIQYHPGEILEDLVGNFKTGFDLGYKIGEVIEGKKTIGEAFGKKKKAPIIEEDNTNTQTITCSSSCSCSCDSVEVEEYTFLNTLKGSKFINGNLKKILKKKEKKGFFLKSLEINDSWTEIRITTVSETEGTKVDVYELEKEENYKYN